MPPRGSGSAAGTTLGSGNASELDRGAKDSGGPDRGRARPSAGPPAPRAASPHPLPRSRHPPLPSCSEAPPPSAPSSASTTQGSSTAGGTMEATSLPGSRSGSRYRPGPLPAGRTRAPLRRDPADGGSRKLRSCRSLCHAPDPPGGDGRRKRGGGGSSSRAAPAPARGGEAAGADLGEGAGSSGAEACAKRGNIWLWQGREAGGGWSRSCSNFTWGAGSSKACCRGGLLQHSRGTPGNGSAEEETWVKQTWRRRGLTFWPASVSAALHLVDTVIKCEKSKTDRDYAELWKLEALIKYLLPPSSHLSFHLIYFLGKHKICCGLASYTNCFSLAIYMSLSLIFISSSLHWVFLL